MQFILKWIIFAVALYLTFWTGEKFGLEMHPSDRWQDNAVMAAILGLVNATLLRIVKLTLKPVNCLTFGIAGVIVNALFFWIVFKVAEFGFYVGSFWAALYGSVVLGAINGVLSAIFAPSDKEER